MSESDKSRWREEEIEKFLKTTEWRRAKDAKGRTYYYVKGSKSTQWTPPAELVAFEKSLDAKQSESKEEGNNTLDASNVQHPETAIGKVGGTGEGSSPSLISADSTAVLSAPTVSSSVSATFSVSSLQQSIKVPVKIAAKIGQKAITKNPFAAANYESDDDDHAGPMSKGTGSCMTEENIVEKTITSLPADERKNHLSPDPESEDAVEVSHGDEEHSKKRGVEEDSILAAKDSISNPTAIEHARKRAKEDPSLISEILNSFVNHYTGYHQLSNILVEWLAYADYLTQIKGTTTANANSSSLPFGSVEKPMQSVQERKYEQLLCLLLSSRFSRKAADESDSLAKALEEGGWARGLVDDEIVSSTMRDLYQKYPESSFLCSWIRLVDDHQATNASVTEPELMEI